MFGVVFVLDTENELTEVPSILGHPGPFIPGTEKYYEKAEEILDLGGLLAIATMLMKGRSLERLAAKFPKISNGT